MKPVRIVPLREALPPTHKDLQHEQWHQVIAHHYLNQRDLTNENITTHDTTTKFKNAQNAKS